MSIDRAAASEAISDMQRSAMRSGQLYGYATASPYLFLAGLAWLAADLLYAFTDFGWAWPAVSGVLSLACVAVAIMQARRRTRGEQAEAGRPPALDGWFWRGMAVWAVIVLFSAGVLAVFGPFSGVEAHSFTGLLTGAIYAIAGLFMGRRILLTGLAVAALSLVGHFYAGEHYAIFMGVVCGGGMMLCAAWLRKV
jgi:hypothetical protein